jgi:hypothetical protein
MWLHLIAYWLEEVTVDQSGASLERAATKDCESTGMRLHLLAYWLEEVTVDQSLSSLGRAVMKDNQWPSRK